MLKQDRDALRERIRECRDRVKNNIAPFENHVLNNSEVLPLLDFADRLERQLEVATTGLGTLKMFWAPHEQSDCAFKDDTGLDCGLCEIKKILAEIASIEQEGQRT